MDRIEKVIEVFSYKFGPYIIVGAIGAIIHRIRHKMTWRAFLGTLFISTVLSVSIGFVARDYFEIQKESFIYALCGLGATYSKLILDELEEAIASLSDFIKMKFGLNPEQTHTIKSEESEEEEDTKD